MKGNYKFIKPVILSTLTIILIIPLYLNGNFRSLDNIISDFIVKKWTAKNNLSQEIVLLLLSQDDLTKAQKEYQIGWPWKREMFAKVIDFLNYAGAKLIIFDYIFTEKSVYNIKHTSINDMPNDDIVFSNAIKQSKNVVLPFYFLPNKDQNKKELDNKYLSQKGLPIKKKINSVNIKEYHTAILPIPVLLKNTLSIGTINASKDPDNTFRRLPVIVSYNGKYYPNLTLSAMIKYLNIKNIHLEQNKLIFNNHIIPLDNNGNARLKYYGSNSVYKDFYMMEVLKIYDLIKKIYPNIKKMNNITKYNDLFKNPQLLLKIKPELLTKYPKLKTSFGNIDLKIIPKNAFLNKIVLLGSIVPGHFEYRPTPFNSKEAGIHLHATFLNNFLNNDFLIETHGNITILLIIIILSITASICMLFISQPWNYIANLSMFVLLMGISILLFIHQNMIIDTFTLSLTIMIQFIGGTIINSLDYIKDKIYKTLILNSPIGILTLINDKIILANKSVTRLLGMNEPNALINKSLLKFVHPMDYDLLKNFFTQYSDNNIDINNIRLITFNKQEIVVNLNINFFVYEKMRTLQIVVNDITEQKRIQRLREDTERIVKHDLKAPLTGIIGFSELLIPDLVEERKKKFATSIHQSAYKMLHLINHSLDLFKMEEGSYLLNPIEVNLVSILLYVENNLKKLIILYKLEIKYFIMDKQISNDEIYNIYGESIYLEALFSNLLKNAIEASPEGEIIKISISKVGNFHYIDFHNQGVIPESIRDNFFDRYTTYGKEYGTGLGTFSSRIIAKAHRGDISFTTSNEEGTHVTVILPVKIEDY